jgi:hypothetical protein
LRKRPSLNDFVQAVRSQPAQCSQEHRSRYSGRQTAFPLHGLTAETVIGALEDAEDYREFEAAIIADYDAQSAVERELVLRLASLLWLRRATTMETGLFEIQADHLRGFRQARQVLPTARKAVVYAMFERLDSISYNCNSASHDPTNATEVVPSSEASPIGPAVDPNVELARCFLRLANLPNFALDRLSRYEATLWRQVGQILLALDALDRRKPQERRPLFRLDDNRPERPKSDKW